jgi:hypothetical protein
MSSIFEQIELLQIELRNCVDHIERIQVRDELAAAIAEVAREEHAVDGAVPDDPRPG